MEHWAVADRGRCDEKTALLRRYRKYPAAADQRPGVPGERWLRDYGIHLRWPEPRSETGLCNVANVDPVGACVGINGARVKAIVNELGNEQIDIIEWDSNSAQLIVNALSPAKVVSAVADDEEKKAKIVVSEQQLSLAIGKQGQNVRLAAKLTGYGIDIKSEAEPEEHTEEENLEEEYVEPSEISLDEE